MRHSSKRSRIDSTEKDISAKQHIPISAHDMCAWVRDSCVPLVRAQRLEIGEIVAKPAQMQSRFGDELTIRSERAQ
eukprot:3882792-Rhodomonas_salina.11